MYHHDAWLGPRIMMIPILQTTDHSLCLDSINSINQLILGLTWLAAIKPEKWFNILDEKNITHPHPVAWLIEDGENRPEFPTRPTHPLIRYSIQPVSDPKN